MNYDNSIPREKIHFKMSLKAIFAKRKKTKGTYVHKFNINDKFKFNYKENTH